MVDSVEKSVLTEEQLKQLDIYAKELIKYNEHTNLTAIKVETEIYLKHLLQL